MERSSGRSTGPWNAITDLPAGSESFNDSGLAADTTYYYQVRAFNDNGESSFTDPASAKTDVAQAIELSASKGKLKGKHSTTLNWTSASGSNMDIWEGTAKVANNVAGTTYTHNTANKRAATYNYQVCETGGTTVCSTIVTVNY